MIGASLARKISQLWQDNPVQGIVVTPDQASAYQLEKDIHFFAPNIPCQQFPDWETLAYDILSPHQSVISNRIAALNQLLKNEHKLFFMPIKTLMHTICPVEHLGKAHMQYNVGDVIDHEDFKNECLEVGYTIVNKVMEPGECAFRGSIIDIYPTGITAPLRIDLFDKEIDSIKTFDVETQRSTGEYKNIELLPGHEFPTDENAISLFRKQWREKFPGKSSHCPIYQDVSEGIFPSGIEYYLPLFFKQSGNLFQFLNKNCQLFLVNDLFTLAEQHYQDVKLRYQQRSSDITRPILPVNDLFLSADQVFMHFKQFERHELNQNEAKKYNAPIEAVSNIEINRKLSQPLAPLKSYIEANQQNSLLIVAESIGRQDVLMDLFQQANITATKVTGWQQFVELKPPVAITQGSVEQGCQFAEDGFIILTETQFFGERSIRQKTQKSFDPDVIIRSLTELKLKAPVVHIEHGVGRYQGLQKIETNGQSNEFLVIQYADEAKIYVPVTSLHLISRYTGGAMETAPLHRLGGDTWQKEKSKAEEKISDVAAELLDIYAEREAKRGFQFERPNEDYFAFADSFPFEETEDQRSAIASIIGDMCSPRPMDRLICGDVGFGKTEVAMRAAFLAIQSGKQVCVLVPTTLLASQHHENFVERFSQFPITVELLSRFRTKKETDQSLENLKQGTSELVVGTHKLFSKNIKFKDLGLLIVDEEHRFGVKQKEHIKALKKDIDILTMTATPIPRTLNMAMANIRDISIIATPPAKRLAIKTFCHEKGASIIKEAVMREILRGGQVFFLHNEVDTIQHMAEQLTEWLPQAKIEIAHGQMRERQLEKIMSDFYHQKFNVLVCTTIIETGIDIPTANTIIINRADKFGLAQLHQLRGRVGRGHQQAYAYLLTPNFKSLSRDAQKRLEALLSLEDLGAGFTLATHDLEIRGAGELLGDEQSGHMHALGFSLYMELLDRAVNAIKSGKTPELSKPLDQGPEINLNISTIIPEDYIGDIHTRLIFYKRIANAENSEALQSLQAELIDRFGLLPSVTKLLFKLTELKLQAQQLGIQKINLRQDEISLLFNDTPQISPSTIIHFIQVHPARYKLRGANKLAVKIELANEIIDEVFKVLLELQNYETKKSTTT